MSTTDNSRQPRVLIVDDSPENIVLLGRLLAPNNLEVISAGSGKEALERIAESPPDVILLDLVMPEMDGYEVCEHIRGNPKTNLIPIVILTGESRQEANIRALEAGADDFLTRPIDTVLLRARINNSLRVKRLQDRILDYQRRLEHYNEELEETVRQRTAQVEHTQQVAVFSLAKLSESRDTETGRHLDRMRDYTRELAHEMQTWPKYEGRITRSFLDRIFYSSPLHDIGKVGIPDQILLKPGKLTPEEFDVMKFHTTIGGDTLKAAEAEAGADPFLSMGRDIAYYHHERWNGAGYPCGLSGTAIPLEARIVALADVYDALTSRRPYKEPMSHAESRGIILEGRGTQFDPDVVDAFLGCEARIVAISDALQGPAQVSPLEQLIERLDHVAKESQQRP